MLWLCQYGLCEWTAEAQMIMSYSTMHPVYAVSTWSYGEDQLRSQTVAENSTHQVRVTGILDRHDTDSVQFTGSRSEVDVGTLVVVDRGLGTGGNQLRGFERVGYSTHSMA